MTTTLTARALALILGVTLYLPAQTVDADAAVVATGQAHTESDEARRAMKSCDLDKARRHLTAAQLYLDRAGSGSDAATRTVRDMVAALDRELKQRESLAARAQEDVATLVRNQAWREAEIRLATAASTGCVAHLAAYQQQVSKAVSRPRAYAGPAARAGTAVKALMVIGTIAGGGWVIHQRLRTRNIF